MTCQGFEMEMVTDDETLLLGVAALASPSEREAYGLHEKDSPALPEGFRAERTWRGCRFSAAGEALEKVLSSVVRQPLADFTASRKRTARKAG